MEANEEHLGTFERPAFSPLSVRVGSAGDAVLRVKVPPSALLEPTGEPGVTAGTVRNWRRVHVYTANRSRGADSGRYFELTPGDTDNEIAIGAFYVRGKFVISAKVNNPNKARDVFDRAVAE